jgi:hypothetical protein
MYTFYIGQKNQTFHLVWFSLTPIIFKNSPVFTNLLDFIIWLNFYIILAGSLTSDWDLWRKKLLFCSLLSENDAHRVKTITISLHKRIYKMKTKSSTSAINPITIIEKIKNTPKKSYIHTKSQRPRSDLDKRSLSRPNTTKAVWI